MCVPPFSLGHPEVEALARQELLEDSGPQHLPEFKYNREDGGQVSIAFLEAMRTNTTVQSMNLKLFEAFLLRGEAAARRKYLRFWLRPLDAILGTPRTAPIRYTQPARGFIT